jgi:hypothetical protein
VGGFSATVAPLATADDAAEALSNVPQSMVRNPRTKVRATGERVVSGITVAGSHSTWAYECGTVSARGDGIARHLSCTSGRVLYGVSASGLAEMWHWDQVVLLAERSPFALLSFRSEASGQRWCTADDRHPTLVRGNAE